MVMHKDKVDLIFDKSIEIGHNNFVPKSSIDNREFPINGILPKSLQRKDLDLPDVPEPVLTRHFVDLSRRNYGVDNGIYPLGSCTMKYNPKVNETIARLSSFSKIHPLQKESQGCLEIIFKLGKMLEEICGMDAFTLNPDAGAQGELTGILIIKKYLEENGKNHKNKIIVPDSAHGTNPASAAMSGFSIIELDSNEKGEIPLGKLEFAMEEGDVGGLMLTNPNTLGLFDRQILEITEIVRKNDGICYYDGANLNPMLGVCRPGDMGFQIVHLNLHKTFSTPHGGGGPGAGPVGVKKEFEKYLPVPRVIKEEEKINESTSNGTNSNTKYKVIEKGSSSIGRINNFYGNFGVLLRAYAYIRGLGAQGLRNVGEKSVLNANYLKTHLKQKYNIPYNRNCMHEFVIKAELPNGVNAEDVAKRLLDYGVYAPTVYFPLIVHEAMMIEPTETESKHELDYFIQSMLNIYDEAENNPELVKNAPHSTTIGRLDATLAARKPHLTE